MGAVKEFLIKNGFIEVGLNHYGNDKCDIKILYNRFYKIIEDGNSVYSDSLNIYWLIGYLTYYNFMDKNYMI